MAEQDKITAKQVEVDKLIAQLSDTNEHIKEIVKEDNTYAELKI